VEKTTPNQSINFLRGVPSEQALSRLIPLASDGYKKAIERYGIDVLQYGHFTGFKPLRELLGDLHQVNPERVIIGNGGLEVISLFLKSLPKNSTIIIEQATYDRVLSDAKQYGIKLIGVRLTRDGVDLDQFRDLVNQAAPRAFYGIPFHQNPTGINYTRDNRKAVEQMCRENDILCVWDVCYQQLRYDGKENSRIDISEWGPILASSFTKTISPGTKCGYIIVPNHYVPHLSRIIANTRINPNLPTQAFIADFIESGEYDHFLEYLCELYKPRMAALNTTLGSHFPGSFQSDVSGGFFACLTLEAVCADKETDFINAAKEAGVGIAAAWDAVAPGFQPTMRQKGLFVRLTFPAYEPDKIEWGISTLKQTVDLFGD